MAAARLVISTAVVAHPARLIAATELAATVHGTVVIDDTGIGCNANHLRAWELTAALESEWAAVFEDDAEPIAGFMNQVTAALAAAPEPVVSMYLGRTRPVRWQDRIGRAAQLADEAGSHWITSTHTIHAVALAVHTELLPDWLDWAHHNTLPPDERMAAWCVARHHRVAYTWPSLVNHADGPTLVTHSNTGGTTAPRRAWRVGTRDTWTPAATRM